MPPKCERPTRSVRVDFFVHPRTRDLGVVGKALFIYLLTPHFSGLARLSVRSMRNDLDRSLSLETVESALADLVAAELIEWDPENEVVWVRGALRKQVRAKSGNESLGISMRRHMDSLPPSRVVDAFVKGEASWLAASGVIEPTESNQVELRLVQEPEIEPNSPQRAMADLEVQVLRLFEQAMGVAMATGSGAHTWAFERVAKGEVSVEGVEAVIAWWRCQPGDTRGTLRNQFSKAEWGRVAALALGRSKAPGGKAKPTVGLAANSREADLRTSGQRVWDPVRRRHVTAAKASAPVATAPAIPQYGADDYADAANSLG